MLPILLMILKIIGMVLLSLLALAVLLLLLVLFVPIRYRISGYRKSDMEAPVCVRLKVSWLLGLVRVLFAYPEAAYVKVKILFVTIFSTAPDRKAKAEAKAAKAEAAAAAEKDKQAMPRDESPNGSSLADTDATSESAVNQNLDKSKTAGYQDGKPPETESDGAENDTAAEEKPPWWSFFNKIRDRIKNIRYTLQEKYDKIKDTVLNIRDYIEIIKSDEFRSALSLCAGQLLRIVNHIKPTRLHAHFALGMKDPGTTGQILEIYSILYPVIGNNVFITPDFEQEILVGDFNIKGRISVGVLLAVAWKIYRDANIRKLIRMLKGRKRNVGQ